MMMKMHWWVLQHLWNWDENIKNAYIYIMENTARIQNWLGILYKTYLLKPNPRGRRTVFLCLRSGWCTSTGWSLWERTSISSTSVWNSRWRLSFSITSLHSRHDPDLCKQYASCWHYWGILHTEQIIEWQSNIFIIHSLFDKHSMGPNCTFAFFLGFGP